MYFQNFIREEVQQLSLISHKNIPTWLALIELVFNERVGRAGLEFGSNCVDVGFIICVTQKQFVGASILFALRVTVFAGVI